MSSRLQMYYYTIRPRYLAKSRSRHTDLKLLAGILPIRLSNFRAIRLCQISNSWFGVFVRSTTSRIKTLDIYSWLKSVFVYFTSLYLTSAIQMAFMTKPSLNWECFLHFTGQAWTLDEWQYCLAHPAPHRQPNVTERVIKFNNEVKPLWFDTQTLHWFHNVVRIYWIFHSTFVELVHHWEISNCNWIYPIAQSQYPSHSLNYRLNILVGEIRLRWCINL